MRPIKFRAWNKHSKKMFNVLEVWFKENTTHPNGPVGALIDTSPYAVFCEFDVLELMQFTGLHDKNGKEIWEGDILSGPAFNYRVVFHAGGFCALKILPVLDQIKEGDEKILWYMPYSIENLGYGKEVLGNIYENPELLKDTP